MSRRNLICHLGLIDLNIFQENIFNESKGQVNVLKEVLWLFHLITNRKYFLKD